MWEQCFVIGASVHHRMCICMWCLLPGKQRRYYEEALNFLRGRTSPVVPGKVLCDFEKAEMAAIRAVFPTAQIKCCMFHYGQSLYRNFKRLGLVHLYGEKTEYGEAVRNTFRRVLSLPLLPPDIIRRAFSIIVASSPPGMPVFFLYFSRTYIGLTQRQLLDGVNAFGDNRLNFSPIGNHSSLGTTISTINSEHSYAATPVSSASAHRHHQLLHGQPLSSVGGRNRSGATFSNSDVEHALTGNKGLCHHPALSDFICGVNESIDRQVDAARSARHFIHKRHKRYILQDAVIMRILADASYNSNGDIHDLMTALGLQVEGYAGKWKDFENFDDSIVHVPLLDISWFFTLLDISWLGQFVAWTFRGLDISWLGHFVAWTFRGLDILWGRQFLTFFFLRARTFSRRRFRARPTFEDTTFDDPTFEDLTEDTRPTFEDTTFDDPTFEDLALEDTTFEDTTFDDPTFEDLTLEDTTFEDTTFDDPTFEDLTLEDLHLRTRLLRTRNLSTYTISKL
ncbi:hypothetical protein niasHS_003084 [Heterodera schachtii]|uniref:MULE transposase domain-containing protein n=1 Tax=Heterodera schachtii TaxID=97005 RepID=A0ABD2K9M5_HETSC